jgi:ABC-type nitrate/sulfonate/bicarbonate transport system substrate-binding protein
MIFKLVRGALLLVVWVVVALSPTRSFAQELLRVPYGVTTSLQHLPILVGKDSGLFAKYGLNVEPVHIRGGALITTMIMSGTVQFSGAGAESVVSARIEGGDVALIACPADTDVVYFVARPEFKNPLSLKGKSSAVTRLGSTTHFYLRAALRSLGLDPEKDMTILQLGGGGEIVTAMRSGRVAAAALPYRNTFSLIQMGWPLLVDLSTPNFIYPSSCVATSRAFIKGNLSAVERFLKAYIEAGRLIKKDSAFVEQVIKKWHRETDSAFIKKTVEVYAKIFKPIPYVSDQGLEIVLKELSARRPVSKEFFGRPELFRDHGPLEKLVKEGGIERVGQ